MRIPESWQALVAHSARLSDVPLRALLAADPARAADFALQAGPLYASFARQRYDRDALAALLALAQAAGTTDAMRALVEGEQVNASEARAALHTALRSTLGTSATARVAQSEAAAARTRMQALAAQLDATNVTDIVHVGIGGSDLGPRLASEALRDFERGRFRVHFLGNADAHPLHRLLPTLDPAGTAVVLVSKSFGTQETLLNGTLLREWLDDDSRLFAVTANPDRAHAFGVDATRVLPMWDWVGGRYSLWSAVGFTLMLAIGGDNFSALLAGAAELDAHALEAAPEENLPLRHALTCVWNRNALGLDAHAVVPYDERLALLPAYLQQLVMESLGKSVRRDGTPVAMPTVPVWWGGAGTASQHSFFQALHQGTDTVPVDFIGVARPAHAHAASHDVLLAHLLAQMEALANGEANEDAQRRYPGNRPSTLVLLDELTPRTLGALLAMFEHSVYLQSILWGINAFDQWGVELGKRVADRLLPAVAAGDAAGVGDAVSRELLVRITRARGR
ncbi:MAG: glucose-6-phosphate isomerase [Arenimonas sp.]